MTLFKLCPKMKKQHKKKKDAEDFKTCYSQVKIKIKIAKLQAGRRARVN